MLAWFGVLLLRFAVPLLAGDYLTGAFEVRVGSIWLSSAAQRRSVHYTLLPTVRCRCRQAALMQVDSREEVCIQKLWSCCAAGRALLAHPCMFQESGKLLRRRSLVWHRCAALDTFEAMLGSGCRPHAAVYSSIIDVLWQTGISWAQAKALHLFTTAVQCAAPSSAIGPCLHMLRPWTSWGCRGT